MPSRAAPTVYAQPIAAAPNNWTGFYLGANLGGLWGHNTGGDVSGYSLDSSFYNFSASALRDSSKTDFTFGGTAGYNYQIGDSVVAGVEVDYNWSNADSNSAFTFNQPVWNGIATYRVDAHSRSKMNGYGSLRARLGYLVTPSFMVYATGGAALGNVKSSGGATETLTAFGYDMDLGSRFGSKSKTLYGWTAGGGGEYAFNRNWSVKAEYLYTDLGKHEYVFYAENPGVYQFGASQKHQFSVARVGLNYRF
ncbi:membrane protein [Camelimonas fluminis]|nr:membrane protein [Camelimonas fluminis]